MVRPAAGRASGPTATVDAERLLGRLDRLAVIGAVATGGVTRLAWSAEDRLAVDLVAQWAAATGAEVHVDPVGTLVADLPGGVEGLAPLAMGSHLDTVVGAGSLDGAYGVVVAVEVMAAVAASGRGLRHPLRIAAFANEEGVVAPPFTGSRAIGGADLTAELDSVGPDGQSLAVRIDGAGGASGRLTEAAWGRVAGYLEVHIEQGPVLDATGERAGVVTAITGQQRARVEVAGRANHAGTTPMAMRHDALAAAARAVLAVEALATDGRVEVATVGRLTVTPDVPNVIPGRVVFSVDVRSVDDSLAVGAIRTLEVQLDQIAAATRTEIQLFSTTTSPAVATNARWRELLHASCRAFDVAPPEMPSGAGHDAQHLAAIGPVGMLFVPSVGGVSHHPAERTAPADLVLGARVALDAVLTADEAFDA